MLGAASRTSFVVASGVVSILVARLLGPEGSGAFAVISSLFFTLLVLSTAGIDVGVSWMLGARRWEARSALASTALAALLLGLLGAGAGMGVYLLAAGSAFSGIDAAVALTVLAALPAGLLHTFFAQAAVATERYESAAAIGMTQSALYVAGAATLAGAYGLEGAAAALLVGQTGGAVAALVWWRRVPADGSAGVDVDRLRRAAGFGVKIWIANAGGILLYRFDLFLLNGYSGGAEAGYYGVALAVAAVLVVLPSALGSVLVPRLASLDREATGERRTATETKALRHTLLMQGTSTALLALALPVLLEPVFGEDFGPALAPAMILLPGAAALGVGTILYSALAGRGRPDYAMRIAIGILPPAIGLYFLMVPALGAEGAAIASDLVYGTSVAIAWICLRRLGGPGVRESLPGRGELADYRALAQRTRE